METFTVDPNGEWPEWSQLYDPGSASYYYYNNYTGDSTWETPPNFVPSETSTTTKQSLLDLYPPFLKSVLRIQRVYRGKKERHALRIRRATKKVISSVDEEEWITVYDPQHKCDYYFNTETGECLWEKPPGFEHNAEEQLPTPVSGGAEKQEDNDKEGAEGDIPEWVRIYDPSSSGYYYFNNFTMESVWEKPEGYVEVKLGQAKLLMGAELKAAIALQCAFRARIARRDLRQQRGKIEVERMEDGPEDEWTKVLDPSSNCHYYYNATTGECSWDPPEGEEQVSSDMRKEEDKEALADETVPPVVASVDEAPEVEEASCGSVDEGEIPSEDDNVVSVPDDETEAEAKYPGGSPWVELYDSASGAYYYYNQESGESTWEPPSCFSRFSQDLSPVVSKFAAELRAAVAVQKAWRIKLARKRVEARRNQVSSQPSSETAQAEADNSVDVAQASVEKKNEDPIATAEHLNLMAVTIQSFWRTVKANDNVKERRSYLNASKETWHSLLVEVNTSVSSESTEDTLKISCGSFDRLDNALIQPEWRPKQGYLSFGSADRGVYYTDVVTVQSGASCSMMKITDLFELLYNGGDPQRRIANCIPLEHGGSFALVLKLFKGKEERHKWVRLRDYKLRELFFDRSLAVCSAAIDDGASGVCCLASAEIDRAVKEAVAAFEFNQLNSKDQALRRSRYRDKVDRQREGDAVMEAAKCKYALLLKQVCSCELSFDVTLLRAQEVKRLREMATKTEGVLLDFELQALDEVISLLNTEIESFTPDCDVLKTSLVKIKPETLDQVTKLTASLVEQSTIIEAQLFVVMQQFLERSETSVRRSIEALEHHQNTYMNNQIPVRLEQRAEQLIHDLQLLLEDMDHMKRGPATAVSAAFQLSRYERMVKATEGQKDDHWMTYFDETYERVVFRNIGTDDYSQVAVWDKPPRIKARDADFVLSAEDGNGILHFASKITKSNSALRWFKCAMIVVERCIVAQRAITDLTSRIEDILARRAAAKAEAKRLAEETHRRVNELDGYNSLDATRCRKAFIDQCRAAWKEGLRRRATFDNKLPVTPKANSQVKEHNRFSDVPPATRHFVDPFEAMANHCSLEEFKQVLEETRRRREVQEKRPFEIDRADRKSGDILLHKACWYGRKDLIEHLLERGASVNVPMSSLDRANCFHVAICAGKQELIPILFERGASICTQDAHGDTPLHVACRLNYLGAVEEILKLVQSKDAEGMRLKYAKLVLCTNKRGRLASEVVLIPSNLHKNTWVQQRICSLLWYIEEKARDRLQFCSDYDVFESSSRVEDEVKTKAKSKKATRKKKRKKKRGHAISLKPIR